MHKAQNSINLHGVLKRFWRRSVLATERSPQSITLKVILWLSIGVILQSVWQKKMHKNNSQKTCCGLCVTVVLSFSATRLLFKVMRVFVDIYVAVIYDEEFSLRTVLPGIQVKLILVGSLNCAATHINTLHADREIDSSADIYEHYQTCEVSILSRQSNSSLQL